MEKQQRPRSDKDVVTYQKFTGLRNDISPERFEPGDLDAGLNIDIDKSGRIARRGGYTKRGTFNAHSLWAKDDTALFMDATALNILAPGPTASQIAVLSTDDRVSYAEANGRVYLSNGTDTAVVESGAARSWGLPVPSLPTATVVAGTAIPAGTYQYVVTYVRTDGQESGAGLAGVIELPAGGTIKFDIPSAGHQDVVSKNLYLTQPDGTTLYLAMTLPDVLPSYTIDPADLPNMVEPLQTQFMQSAPAGQLVAYYRGRMFVAKGDTLYPSEPYAYELFDLRNFIALDGQITLLASVEDRDGALAGFFIGTDKSCGILTGNGPEDFKYVPKVDYGAILGSLAYVEGSLYGDGSNGARLLPMFLTEQGLCVGMPNMEVDNLSRTTFQYPAGGTGAAIFFPGENRLVMNSSVSPCIVMQTENQTFTQYTNFQFNSFAFFDDTYYGAKSDGLYELGGEDDDGTPIDGLVRFGITDFSTAYVKMIDRVYFGFRSDTDMNITARVDENLSYTYSVPASPDLNTSRVRVGKGLCGRYWQFEISNTAGGDFTIDMVDVKAVRYQRRVNGRA